MRPGAVLAPGTVVDGRYRLEAVVGTGGMGTVYAARHEVLGRRVAVKVLHAEYAERPDAVQRFIREARTVAQLGHEHICEAIDFGSVEELPYFVMPLLEGAPLSQWMERGELDLGRLVDIGVQVLTALEVAHDRRVVHRDLKPDNLFIARTAAGADWVKLLDFGISKVLDVSGTAPTTSTGALLGTTHYMAPEQARGARRVGPRCDLYSLGVVLYQASSGWLPFTGANEREVLYRIMTAPLVPLGHRNHNLPRAFYDVVMRALARDPAARFASATEMRAALEKARALPDFPGDQRLPAWRGDAAPLASGQARDERTESLVLADRAAVTTQHLGGSTVFRISSPPERPRSRGRKFVLGTAALIAISLVVAAGLFGMRRRAAGALPPERGSAWTTSAPVPSAQPPTFTTEPPTRASGTASPEPSSLARSKQRSRRPRVKPGASSVASSPRPRPSARQPPAMIHGRFGTTFEPSLP